MSKKKQFEKLAQDILDGKVFTSRHIFVMAEGNEEEYLKLMRACFLPEAFKESVEKLRGLLASDLFDGVLFYEYLTENKCPNPDILPIFQSAKLICGKDLKKFDRILTSEYKNRLN